MATKVSLIKKGAAKGSVQKAAPGFKAVEFQFQNNGDSTCTVFGLDAAGNQIEISAVAKLLPVPTSSDSALVTVDPPTGMTFTMHGVGPLSTPGTPVHINVTASWNDNSVGPFVFSLDVDVISGGAVGIIVVPGAVTTH